MEDDYDDDNKWNAEYKYFPGCNWLTYCISAHNMTEKSYEACLKVVTEQEKILTSQVNWLHILKNKSRFYEAIDQLQNRKKSFNEAYEFNETKINRLEMTIQASTDSEASSSSEDQNAECINERSVKFRKNKRFQNSVKPRKF